MLAGNSTAVRCQRAGIVTDTGSPYLARSLRSPQVVAPLRRDCATRYSVSGIVTHGHAPPSRFACFSAIGVAATIPLTCRRTRLPPARTRSVQATFALALHESLMHIRTRRIHCTLDLGRRGSVANARFIPVLVPAVQI